jgi:hypothetical protein
MDNVIRVKVPKPPCATCGGTGSLAYCDTCGGYRGFRNDVRDPRLVCGHRPSAQYGTVTCPDCDGKDTLAPPEPSEALKKAKPIPWHTVQDPKKKS